MKRRQFQSRVTGAAATTLKISTAAAFNGNRWTTNALLHQVPGGCWKTLLSNRARKSAR
jgi:hypothetical protein